MHFEHLFLILNILAQVYVQNSVHFIALIEPNSFHTDSLTATKKKLATQGFGKSTCAKLFNTPS